MVGCLNLYIFYPLFCSTGLYETQLSFKGQKALCSGIIWRASEYKIVVSFDKMDDLNISELQSMRLSVVIIANEVTHKRHKEALETLRKVYSERSHPANHFAKVLIGEEQLNAREAFEKTLGLPAKKEVQMFNKIIS